MNITKDKSKKRFILIETSIVLFAIFSFIYAKYGINGFQLPCIVREDFGIICPSCGATRTFKCLSELDFKSAFAYHPTAFIYFFVLLFGNFLYIYEMLRFGTSHITSKVLIGSIWFYVALSIFQYILRLIFIFNGVRSEFFYTDLV